MRYAAKGRSSPGRTTRGRPGFRTPGCRGVGGRSAPAAVLALAAAGGLATAGGVGPGGVAADGAVTGPGARSGAVVVAFVGVHVVPMDRERVLPDRTVIVRDGRIATIGDPADVPVPGDAVRVEGAGRWLIPGLAEMHAHVPGPDAPPGLQERILFLYLARGVTTIRGMLGHPTHLDLRERLARGEVIGPRLITSGPSLNGNSIPDPDSARRAVRHQAAAGYDFLKVHPGLSRASWDAIAAEAKAVGIDFAGHVPLAVGIRRALDARQASVDHLDGYVEAILADGAPVGAEASLLFGFNLVEHVDPAKIPELARATREAGVWNVPTQALFEELGAGADPEELAARPDLRYVPAPMASAWGDALRGWRANPQLGWTPERGRRFLEVRRAIIRELHAAGAGLLLGSDAPQVYNVPGFSIVEELEALVAAGLTPYEALVTGTRAVAEFLGEEEERGTVEPGKVADLVLLGGDPLADVAAVGRVKGVMREGRWLGGEEMQARLRGLRR